MFTGADGARYEVAGEGAHVFNLVSAPELQVHSRFRDVPERFAVHDLTHTVLGDLGIAVRARGARARAHAGAPSAAGRTIRIFFPAEVVISSDGAEGGEREDADAVGCTVDGVPLPFGRARLAAAGPGARDGDGNSDGDGDARGGTWATLERYVCAEQSSACHWTWRRADAAALEVDTRLRRLRVKAAAFTLVATRQQVLKSMPHWLALPLEACGRRQREARHGAEQPTCARELFDAMLYAARAPTRAALGYMDVVLQLRGESCAPVGDDIADGGGRAHAAHGLLGQRACATLAAGGAALQRPLPGDARGAKTNATRSPGDAGALGGGAAAPAPAPAPAGARKARARRTQGEGFIDGVWTDYRVSGSLWSGDYRFNRFSPRRASRAVPVDAHRAPLAELALALDVRPSAQRACQPAGAHGSAAPPWVPPPAAGMCRAYEPACEGG
ncbi:hypothetical protein KFE25_011487 [Diacronema lutheri]|uniref:Uncharacterized protein n=1 Tax=Diacronema lutheri TaxID=2081491 RepID=A0A8J6C4U9_DIALT|nr:hypothetical protein KFE25_009824 [Diacronema lutheri]KAG8462037.1 hypothetical protein KFE25_011487 [Diacronema lutheri]